MQYQISKKQVKGSKVYTILDNQAVIDVRISRNDYTSATVFFSNKDGFDVVYHSAKKFRAGMVDPVESKMRKAGYCLSGVAELK